MHNFRIAAICISLAMVLNTGCGDRHNPDNPEDETVRNVYPAVNLFARNTFNQYYLWSAECSDRMEEWGIKDNPSDAFNRYKYYQDSWGMVGDGYEDLLNSMKGVDLTYGEYGGFFSEGDKYKYIVLSVARGSQAEKAGLKRGDIFDRINGHYVDDSNIADLYAKMRSATTTFTYAESGKEVTMTPSEAYVDPIVVSKTFEFGDRKIGYLFYDSFVPGSVEPLVDIFKEYKEEGVSELILDLRYNSGGYVAVEEVLASLLAPESEVEAGSLFLKEVFNESMTEASADERRCFRTEFNKEEDGFDLSTEGANPGIKKLYVIYTSGSASASEALAVGLGPYMDIAMVGQDSYGKFCTCYLLSGQWWYDGVKDQLDQKEYDSGIKYASDWYAYVTVAKFVDKDGNNACCPDGFKIPEANVVKDNPFDGFQLGDTGESMLNKTLQVAGCIPQTMSVPVLDSAPEIELYGAPQERLARPGAISCPSSRPERR